MLLDIQWYDWWRAVNAVIAAMCLYMLARRWRVRHLGWTAKKLDGWYALCLWSFTALVSSIEGIAQNGDLGARVPLVTAGALVTHKFLYKKPKDEVIDV